MSLSPPPPPPPPPPSTLSLANVVSKPLPNNPSLNPWLFQDVCKWASQHSQLRESCAKNNICLHEPPYKYKYKHFDSIIQVGPTCGLVALSMLVKEDVTPDEILDIVKAVGYSCNGEMFSCKEMVKLSEKVFSLADLEGIRCDLKVGGLCSEETVEKLLAGAVILVPYDADGNHSPCLKQGHTAHWALICGVVIIKDLPEGPTSDPSNVYVLARHGKSRHLAVWKLDELAKSNKNLWEFSPKKGTEGWMYVLPEGGVGGVNGLRNQYLVYGGLP